MVHAFKSLDKHFLMDTESGSIFEIDELTALIVFKREGKEVDLSNFSSQEINEVEQEISTLINEGVLYSAESGARPLTQTVVKALCLNISHDCNLRCKYCFAGEGNYNGERALMTVDIAHKAVDMLIGLSGNRKNLEIDFFGGEPLLNMHVVRDTVAYANKRAAELGKEFRFTITTNALLLDEATSIYLNEVMANVVISIDGRPSVHNNVRRSINGKDVFDLIISNALRFRAMRGDKDYFVRGTFTADNLDFASDIKYLYELGFEKLSVEPVVLPSNHPLSIREEHIPKIIEEYERLARFYVKTKKDNPNFEFFHYALSLGNMPCLRKLVSACGAGCEYLAVSPAGAVFPCHQFVGEDKYKLGTVDSILENSIMNELEACNVFTKPDCNGCWAKYLCSGGCHANNIRYGGGLRLPHKISCSLMKARLERAIAVNNQN